MLSLSLGELAPELSRFPIPPLLPVSQSLPEMVLADPAQAMRRELEKFPSGDLHGKRIAITVGSRKIAGLNPALAVLIGFLKDRGASPFLLAAMGSHGGATPEGQAEVLASYGITEEAFGVPLATSMATTVVGALDDEVTLYTATDAFESDGIIIMNKVKPHADFKGAHESGMVKMLALGMGKHAGALELHRQGFDRFAELLPRAAAILIEKLPVLCGIAFLENPHGQAAHLELVAPERMIDCETGLLETAKNLVARVPYAEVDLLIIDEIGKNVSGEGMDPNVTGRPGSSLPGFPADPLIKRIIPLSVTPESHGNGVGLGMADVVPLRLVQGLDLHAVYTNAITTGTLAPARIPLIARNDRQAIAFALSTTPRISPETCKVVWIRNTSSLTRLLVSPALRAETESHPRLDVLGLEQSLPFDENGTLPPWSRITELLFPHASNEQGERK